MKRAIQNKNNYRITALLLCTALLLFVGACSSEQDVSVPVVATPPVLSAPELITRPATPSPASTPIPSPSATPMVDPIMDIVQGLSDRELIGQMVMCGFSGNQEPSKEFVQLMETYKLGSIILFSSNVHSDRQTTALTSSLNRHNPLPSIPLMIAVDVEGGTVRRFSSWRPNIKSAYSLGQIGDVQFTYNQFVRIATRLKDVGINMDLAPVMDIAPKISGTFLETRMFGTTPEAAAVQIEAAISGLHDGGVSSVGKHFPGHGNTKTDSHSSTPVMQTTKAMLDEYELVPFVKGMDAGVDGIMMGHLLYEKIDPDYPASISSIFITDILREELGFQGVVLSDDMVMRGITSRLDIGDAAVRFIEAGGDIVLIGRQIDQQRNALEKIYNACQDGQISRERLEQSVYRILTLKAKRMGL